MSQGVSNNPIATAVAGGGAIGLGVPGGIVAYNALPSLSSVTNDARSTLRDVAALPAATLASASNAIANATPADAIAQGMAQPPRPSSTPPDVAAFRANRLVEPDVLSNMTAEGVASLAASSGFTSGVPGSVLPHAMMQRAAPEIADEVANTTVNNPYWRSPPQPSGTASTIGRWANNAGEWLGNNWHWAVPTAGGLGALGYYLSNRRRKNDDDEEKNASDRTRTFADTLVEMSQTAPLAVGFLIKCAELRLTAADAIAACKRAAGVDPHIRDEFVKAGLYGKVAARSGQPF
jgi:hypothetical protein